MTTTPTTITARARLIASAGRALHTAALLREGAAMHPRTAVQRLRLAASYEEDAERLKALIAATYAPSAQVSS